MVERLNIAFVKWILYYSNNVQIFNSLIMDGKLTEIYVLFTETFFIFIKYIFINIYLE